ncbi:stage II sporulation protein R [Longirhabdus pacifica]|uniref:stage II sporulation protein R n=1 Tax=Longirhabdus pacifica TaxID=2305227 RepID=UPI00100925A7|nr:stage II sporulation protein R [Longirhabdus pacifica]
MRNHSKFLLCLYVFISFMLIASWEYQQVHAAITTIDDIPEQSIRLRILAHSDHPKDQWIKQQVRNELVQYMNEWAEEPLTIAEARVKIEVEIDQMKQIVGQVLRENDITFDYDVELGMVDFPTKLYGNTVYPAGLYEAVKVTIGDGLGQNWWCVLFPPLCFVDATTGQTVEASTVSEADSETERSDEVQTKFFIWEIISKCFAWIAQLFS